MKKVLLLLVLSLFIAGCNEKKDKLNLQEIIDTSNYILIDVRTIEEYEEKHLDGAINIPYDEIDENIEIDKDKVIFVYCMSGKRSSIAYNTLSNLGYNVFDLGSYNDAEMNFK